MQINSIQNTSFKANLSPELQSKLIALGKQMKRKGKHDEYEELKKHAKTIKELFPGENIKIKPFIHTGILYDMNDKPVLKFPLTSYNIYLERFGENDYTLLKESIHTPSFRLSLHDVKNIAMNLSALANSIKLIDKGANSSKEFQQKIIDDLL